MHVHSCSEGFTTARARAEWLREHGLTLTDANSGLVADPDPKAPLYFWQLHSLLGWRKIEGIVRAFYERIYADTDAPWFRDAFTSISGIEHHIATQAAYWIDAFGGGREYHGGDGRINFHHHHNAASVMTAAGARRWMHHMSLTLNCDIDWSKEDPRVKACIVDFLLTRMRKYANTHQWKFDESDFDALRYAPVHREAELRAMSASQLHKLARERNVSIVGLTERADVARVLATTREQLLEMPTSRLRRLLKERGIATWDLLEKTEYVDAFFRGPGSAKVGLSSSKASIPETGASAAASAAVTSEDASACVSSTGVDVPVGPTDDDDQHSTTSSCSDTPSFSD